MDSCLHGNEDRVCALMKRNFEIVSNNTVLPETFNLVFARIRSNTYQLRTSQIIRLPREQAFSFFQDPRNLSEITPDWLDFRMLDLASGVQVFEGAEYKYTIKWLPWLWKTKWKSRIIRYRPPETFTDIQVKGPYSYWEHLHIFEEVLEGTRMNDVVTYRLPFGPIGQLAHHFLVKGQLKDIFSCRAVRISEWASGNFMWKQNRKGKSSRF
jgi:ligand-binding SRPBCC domain-containing protein